MSDHPTLEQLAALWCGDTDDGLEDHVFTCDACGALYAQLGAIGLGLREVIPPAISHAHRARLVAAGTRIRTTEVEPDVEVDATFTADVDLLVHVLHADLARAERVDLAIIDPGGGPTGLVPGVPFDAAAGEVLIACQRHYMTTFAADPVFELSIHEKGVEAGTTRKLAYRVRHHVA